MLKKLFYAFLWLSVMAGPAHALAPCPTASPRFNADPVAACAPHHPFHKTHCAALGA